MMLGRLVSFLLGMPIFRCKLIVFGRVRYTIYLPLKGLFRGSMVDIVFIFTYIYIIYLFLVGTMVVIQ